MSMTGLPVLDKSDTIRHREEQPGALKMMETFETYRSYLFSIAYRMLGSAMDAEDLVQETYLRYQAAASQTILSLKAYLTTILTRLCIDHLRLAYQQRETYLGPWLPEPILTEDSGAPNAEEATVMQESLSLAFLVMLEQLQPVERAVFLLREVFDYDYADIAAFVGRTEAACRQMFSRARKRLAADQRRYTAPPEVHQRLLTSFIQAVRAGDQTALLDLLAEDARLVADGGGKVPGAAIHPVIGRKAVSLFALGVNTRFLPPAAGVEIAEVNGQTAIVVRAAGRALVVLALEVEDARIKTVRIMANPDKLGRL
jgi:RNA polymerase sigma-70 factor (ECF subfamily)